MRSLSQQDAPYVRSWLRTYLEQHRAWWQAAYGHTPTVSVEELVDRDWAELRELANSEDGFVRVFDRSGPQGVVRAETRPERYMGYSVGVLAWIFVDEAARGTGVAGSLLRGADAWMDEQGVLGRTVYVTAENERAVKLYRRHGYRVVDYRMLK